MSLSQDKEKAIQAMMAEAEDRIKSDDLSGAIHLAQRAHDLCPSLHQPSNLLAALRILRVAARHQQSDKQQQRSAAFWHAILGSKPTDNVDVLKRHYRRLCIQVHPDKNPSAAADGAFKLVAQAFEFLSAKNAATGAGKYKKSTKKAGAQAAASSSTPAAHGTCFDCGGGTKIFVSSSSSSSSSRTTQVRSYVDANGVYRISINC